MMSKIKQKKESRQMYVGEKVDKELGIQRDFSDIGSSRLHRFTTTQDCYGRTHYQENSEIPGTRTRSFYAEENKQQQN
eukprot:CAMPEP_0172439366 /NCGR_PEP_ID=MMETSP1065-20121228/380_1 /TAXON_ID=265537 /ORGANISM="Amphiprora paludosa, Strain CCMP125" /LENGTH=77 /DNA_ID=CAMNT_0013188041 /DNA_START=18 /DNA_END=248 /DNA_ORIENTATION=-